MKKYLLMYSGDSFYPLLQMKEWRLYDSLNDATEATKGQGIDFGLVLELDPEKNTSKEVWNWNKNSSP